MLHKIFKGLDMQEWNS